MIVSDEGHVSMFVVLRDDVSDEAGEIAASVFAVQDLLELSSFTFIKQLKVIVRLVEQLPFHFVDSLFLSQNVS